ncbi:MAG: hypothetical protein N2446_01775 [Elusimicrobiales bacterium]|nr:hypothetical protein [Elusimicrobiales bacterium]
MLFLILNILFLVDENECSNKINNIKTYTSHEFFSQISEVRKKIMDLEKSFKNSNFKVISILINESENGNYYFELDYKPSKKCQYFEIKDYEIDYSNRLEKDVMKSLKLKNIDLLTMQNDRYSKKIKISYLFPYIGHGCLKDVEHKTYKMPIYDSFRIEKIKTSIKNKFINTNRPYFLIEEDEEKEYIYIDYPVCLHEKMIKKFEIKRYFGFLYDRYSDAYKAAIKAVNSFEGAGLDIFYFDTYEENGNFTFFIDWIYRTNKKTEINTYYSKRIFNTQKEAIAELSNSIKNLKSNKTFLIEKFINHEEEGFSFVFRYIEK